MHAWIRTLPSTPRNMEPALPASTDPVRTPVVFVVDDDIATLELLCEIARDAGWTARGFTRLSGLRGSLDEAPPTLLILDDDLPDGRGGDLARELREQEGMADVPILVCTAAHPIRQAEIGAWAPVVSKPFNLAEIDALLSAIARRNDGHDHSAQKAG